MLAQTHVRRAAIPESVAAVMTVTIPVVAVVVTVQSLVAAAMMLSGRKVDAHVAIA